MFWLALKFFRVRLHCVKDDQAQFDQLKEPFIVMFKHGSNIDCACIIVTMFPHWLHYVAKESLFKIPVFGKALYRAAVPIQRDNLQQAIGALNSCVQEIVENKKAVAIAPEGLRRRHDSFTEPKILPFKKGPFHLAKQGKVSILPVMVYGGYRVWPQGQLIPNSGSVVLRYMPLIPKEIVEKSSLEELQEIVKNKYEEGLKWDIPDSFFKCNSEITQCNLIIIFSQVVFYTGMWLFGWGFYKLIKIAFL
eukprot:TRINITY_DN15093_c0_g1_i1.p1 TRINITY_DN15093_c0_g1~~TRINITY_DN15093_c0_g1_i1.p1  ORF type:complete len:249 (-),score=31.80 TRINITY_DN15093_c0_g1_i1:151-897(-)